MGTTVHKRCLGCGYILDGLPEDRCPECGREFHPDLPATYFVKVQSGRPLLVCAAVGLGLVIAGPVLYIAAIAARIERAPDWLGNCVDLGVASIFSVGLALEVLVTIRSSRGLRRPAHLFTRRNEIWAACFLSLTFFLAIAAAIVRALL
jgi:hypothetical protein